MSDVVFDPPAPPLAALLAAGDLHPLIACFARECARFARRYPVARVCHLVIRFARCTLPGACRVRDLAYAEPGGDPPTIVVLARLAGESAQVQRGILRHELGHVCDRWWRLPGAEQRADDLAEDVCGRKVRYDSRDVQTTGAGIWPRPKRLHR
jgi:hypothetical protein